MKSVSVELILCDKNGILILLCLSMFFFFLQFLKILYLMKHYMQFTVFLLETIWSFFFKLLYMQQEKTLILSLLRSK